MITDLVKSGLRNNVLNEQSEENKKRMRERNRARAIDYVATDLERLVREDVFTGEQKLGRRYPHSAGVAVHCARRFNFRPTVGLRFYFC